MSDLTERLRGHAHFFRSEPGVSKDLREAAAALEQAEKEIARGQFVYLDALRRIEKLELKIERAMESYGCMCVDCQEEDGCEGCLVCTDNGGLG